MMNILSITVKARSARVFSKVFPNFTKRQLAAAPHGFRIPRGPSTTCYQSPQFHALLKSGDRKTLVLLAQFLERLSETTPR
jgi:hypothetical protein